MTRKKGFKRKVRARMAETGERYAVARARLMATSRRSKGHPALGGLHNETAALGALLQQAGAVDPFSGGRVSEAMLLGLGGGIGAAYYVFQYGGIAPSLYVETRVAPQYPYDAQFCLRVASGLQIALERHETGSKKSAARALDERLSTGCAAVAWVDMRKLPYHHLSKGPGALPHVIVVSASDGDRAHVYDLADTPFTVSASELADARSSLRKAKHRLITLAEGDISKAAMRSGIKAGLQRCVANLDGTAKVKGYASNMGIKALSKWSELATHSKHKAGWPRVFTRGSALAAGLRQAYFWIEVAAGGGGFRTMYGDFLDEAAIALDEPKLVATAARYRELAGSWSALADRMLPDDRSLLGDLRRCLELIDSDLRTGDAAGIGAARKELDALTEQADTSFPLTESDVSELYADIASRLTQIAQAETAARDELAAIAGA